MTRRDDAQAIALAIETNGQYAVALPRELLFRLMHAIDSPGPNDRIALTDAEGWLSDTDMSAWLDDGCEQ